MQEMIHKAFLRTELPIIFTDGFNPVPRMELATCISLGTESFDEIGSCLLRYETSAEIFMKKLNDCLPPQFKITKCIIYPVTRKKKRVSLATQLYGSEYIYYFKEPYSENADDFFNNSSFTELKAKYQISEQRIKEGEYTIKVCFDGDRPLRDAISTFFDEKIHKIIHIVKMKTLAKDEKGKPIDYFERFSYLASLHEPFLKKARQELAVFDT